MPPVADESSALQTIGSSSGSPVTVSAVPFAQPAAGRGRPLAPSWTTLEVFVCVGAWPLLHAFESLVAVATSATKPLVPLIDATLLRPCVVWQVPSLLMLPCDSAAPTLSAGTSGIPPSEARARLKLLNEPVVVVSESTRTALRQMPVLMQRPSSRSWATRLVPGLPGVRVAPPMISLPNRAATVM